VQLSKGSGSSSLLAVADDHHLDPVYAIKIAESVGEGTYLLGWPPTKQRFEAPLSLVRMTRVEDHVLILVLDCVEFLNHLVVAIIERDERDDFPTRRFEAGVRLDVLQHCFSDRPRPVFEILLLPDSVELFDDLVWNIETRSHRYWLVGVLQEGLV